MRFEDLLEIMDREPVFETWLLLAGDVDPADVRRQLSRWVKAPDACTSSEGASTP
jgi:hypothetical protein